MPLRDVIVAALSRPAGKVVDGPVRDIVHEILAERGYASPAEVAALREETDTLRVSMRALEARLDALEQARAQQPTPPTLPTPTTRSSLIPTIPPPPDEPLDDRRRHAEASAAAGMCKVSGCKNPRYRDGFCMEHAADWRAGRLPGFVSPEGLVSVGGEPRRVAPSFAGQPYAVQGGQVRIDRRTVPSVGY